MPVPLLILLPLAAAACRDQPCLALDPRRDPVRTAEICSEHYERTRDPRAAAAVADALVARKDDAAVVAWANRVGEVPGTARLWRRAYQAYQRRGERADMIAAAERAIRLWQQAGAPGEASYDARTLKDAYLGESQFVLALEAARRERAFALASDDREMWQASFADLFDVLDEIGDQTEAKALLRDMQRQNSGADPSANRAVKFREGLSQFREGHFGLARHAYRDVLAIDEPQRADLDRATLYNLVEIEIILGETAAAAHDLDAAVATLPADPASYMDSAHAFFTALVARARHDAAGAEATLREALTRDPIRDWAWQLEDLLGKALEDQGRLEEALAAYRRAIAVVETLRKELPTDALRTALRDRKRAPYEAAFELEATRGRTTTAMEIAQLMWQRGFQDAFAADSGAGEPGSDGIAAASGGAPGATPSVDPAVARVRSITALVPQLGRPDRDRSAGPASARPGDTAEVLAFVEARGALWRYRRGDGPATLERLALSGDEARRLVDELRAHPDSTVASARLGDALVPPAALAAGAGDRPLAIVSDGALSGLPFAALRVRDRWLVQARTLLYWPALEAIGIGAGPDAGGVAGPAAVLAATAGRGKGFDLVAARAEAVEVSRRLGVEPILGEQATIAALRGAGAARLLHLAAHGGLGPGGAFVRLADGEVTATDVVAWHLAPRTVVLASCASGARPTGSMWGALGGAFLAAGSQAVVATLWSVEDAATAALVRAFYAAGGDRDPARALAMVQRQAIASGAPPTQWTAFVVLAAPR